MWDLIEHNQFMQGLLVTGFVAGLLAYLRNVPHQLWSWFWLWACVRVEVRSQDQAFDWLTQWLEAHPYSRRTRRLRCTTQNAHHSDHDSCYDADIVDVPRKRDRPRIIFSPAPGSHVFMYRGRPVWLSRTKQEALNEKVIVNGMHEREEYDIWIFGRSQSLARQLIQDAMDLALPEDKIETIVYMSIDSTWRLVMRRKPRPIASVILEPGILEKVLADAEAFLASREWYESVGIPYRRGYLFEGAAGSGKTSAILAIAGALELNVFMLSLGARGMDDDKLNNLLSQVPTRSVVLLEDVDATFVGRDMSKDAAGISAVTFSGLLNALDGAAAREGRILFMTTNHVEKLDPALIRPGRADMRLHFGHASKMQAALLFLRFFPDRAPLAAQFAAMTMTDCVPMARIQEHLLIYRDDAQQALGTWADAQLAAKRRAEQETRAVRIPRDRAAGLQKVN